MESKFVIFLLFVFMAGMSGVSQSKTIISGSPNIPDIPKNPEGDSMSGSRGPAGVKGEPEETGNHWKQCVWKREDSQDTGSIQNCTFNKLYDYTSLRVFYAGNLRSHGSGVCNRWYFTFNGEECTKPATIEGAVFVASSLANPLRHRHIEGYCNQVPKGQVQVGFWIGRCGGYSLGDGATGWYSVSRIVIEEVPPPQA